MSEPLKPQFFVLRQNGSLVPLIAMDEIPHNIRITDVPRSMSIQETTGMTNIGPFPSRHRHYVMVDTNSAPNRFNALQFLDTIEPSSDEDKLSRTPVRRPVDLVSAPRRSYGIEERPPSSLEAPVSTTPPGAPIDSAFGTFEPLPQWKDTSELGNRSIIPGKKIYCTHWMSTGECDYAQQGCLYKHEMPLKLEILNALGYQDIPKWYREKYGVGRLTAAPGSGAAVVGPNMRPSILARGTATATWNGFAGANRSQGEHIPAPPRSGRGEASGKTSGRRAQSSQTRSGPRQATPSTSPDLGVGRSSRTIDARIATNNPLNQSRYAPATPADAGTRHHLPSRPATRNSNSITLTPPTPSSTSTSTSSSQTAGRTQANSTSQRLSPVTDHNTVVHRSGGQFHPSNASARRRSSVYSDPEADIIRENDQRRQREDREYAVAVAEARRIKSKGDGEREVQKEKEDENVETKE